MGKTEQSLAESSPHIKHYSLSYGYTKPRITDSILKTEKIDKPHPLLHHGDMRFVIIFTLLYLCYYVLKKAILPTLRTYKIFRNYRASPINEEKEMVQDPQCHTYIPKETALRTTIDGEVYYFCSQECLDEYTRST
jgi:uncharacterized protein